MKYLLTDSEFLKKFTAWLHSYGCEIIPITNKYEILRWKGSDTGVIYTTGKLSGIYAKEAIQCFSSSKKWNGGPVSTGRSNSYKKQKRLLIERDGAKCFYCDEELGEDITLEHLIPLNQGGPNKLSNMVLAHGKCNCEAGHKPINEKVKIAMDIRIGKIAHELFYETTKLLADYSKLKIPLLPGPLDLHNKSAIGEIINESNKVIYRTCGVNPDYLG